MRGDTAASGRRAFHSRAAVEDRRIRAEDRPIIERSGSARQKDRRKMKILAWPAPSRSQANPYLSLVYSEFENEEVEIEPYSTWNARASRADVFHVHWPEAIFWGRIAQYLPVTTKFAAFHALHTMDVVRGRGGILVWTVHNIAPHDLTLRDHERAWDWFFPKFRTRVDALIGLSSRSLDLVCESYPELRSCSRSIVPHPHYRTVYPVPPSVVEARAALSLPQEGFVAAIIGAARRSKGIPSAIQVFRVARRQDERLLIAGHCPMPALRQRSKTRSATMQASYSKIDT